MCVLASHNKIFIAEFDELFRRFYNRSNKHHDFAIDQVNITIWYQINIIIESIVESFYFFFRTSFVPKRLKHSTRIWKNKTFRSNWFANAFLIFLLRWAFKKKNHRRSKIWTFFLIITAWRKRMTCPQMRMQTIVWIEFVITNPTNVKKIRKFWNERSVIDWIWPPINNNKIKDDFENFKQTNRFYIVIFYFVNCCNNRIDNWFDNKCNNWKNKRASKCLSLSMWNSNRRFFRIIYCFANCVIWRFCNK